MFSNGEKELAAYLMSTPFEHYSVKDWNPDEYCSIGDKITVPVSASTYESKNGKVKLAFTLARQKSLLGEEFQHESGR
jgi:hypothetical protein